jgi:hypothetical protein
VTGRRSNPVPPSSTNDRVKKAGKVYEQFTGHCAEYYENADYKPLEVGAKIGKVEGILYRTVRDGNTEHYIHEFKRSAQPDLVADHDGSQIQLVGGDYRFTDRGIIDN